MVVDFALEKEELVAALLVQKQSVAVALPAVAVQLVLASLVLVNVVNSPMHAEPVDAVELELANVAERNRSIFN